jgi:hypothetical protein
VRFAWLAAAALTFAPDASADAVLVAFQSNGGTLSVTRYGTVDATLVDDNRPRTCHYALDASTQADITALLHEPDVQAALHARTPFDGPTSRIISEGNVITWKPHATHAPAYVSLLRLQLDVELLKAKLHCP